MFYKEQPSRDGTLSLIVCLGPARSTFEQRSCGLDVSVTAGVVDRSELDLTKCGDSAS